MINRIIGNALAQAVGLAIAFLDRFVVVGLLMRIWGHQVYSDWAVLLSSVGLLSIGEFGLNIYYGNVLQRANAIGDERLFGRTVAIALTCSLGVAALLGTVSLVMVSAIGLPSSMQLLAIAEPDATAILLIMGVATLSRIARGSVSQILRGRQQFSLGIFLDQAFLGGAALATLAAGVLGAQPVAIAVVYLICDLCLGWGVMLWMIVRRCPDIRLAPALPRASELILIGRSVRWLGIQQAAPIAWLQLPVLILAQLGSQGASLISFIILRTLVNFARTMGNMVSIGAGVESAAVQHRGGDADALHIVHATGRVLGVISVVVAVGILHFGPTVVSLWTGHPEYFHLSVIAPLLIGSIAAAPSTALNSHLMFINDIRPVSQAVLIQLVIGLGACTFLATRYGITGAAVGLCLGEVVGLGIVLPALASRCVPELRYLHFLRSCVGAMIPTAVWCWGVGHIVSNAPFSGATWWLLGIGGILWCIFGIFPIVWLLMRREKRMAFSQQRYLGRQIRPI